MSGEEDAFIAIAGTTASQINQDEAARKAAQADPFGRHSNHVAMLRQQRAQKGGSRSGGSKIL